MHNSKFVTLLGTLDKKEVALFFKYLKQNHGKQHIALLVFEYIRKHYPNFQGNKKLDIEYAHQKIFLSDIAADDYNRTRMLNALSDLHLWLKDFLLAVRAQGAGFEGRLLWLRILWERGLKEEFSRLAAQLFAEKELAEKKESSDYLEALIANYVQFQNLSLAERAPDIPGLALCLQQMKHYMELQQLQMACFVKNLNDLLPPKKTEGKPDIDQPTPTLLLLYREIHGMLTTEDEAHFNILENEFMDCADKLSPGELFVVVRYLHNYVAAQLRKGKEVAYINRIHALNQLGLEKGIFDAEGEISAQSFNNIVSTACGAKDLPWAGKFVKTHSRFLSSEIAEDTRLMAEASIFFEKGAFNDALEKLKAVNYDKPLLVLRARSLALRCLYELKKDVNDVLDYCTSFELQLRANKTPQIDAVDATIHFIRFVKKLVLEKIEKPVLEAQIHKEQNVYFKQWLLQKVQKYKARYAPKSGKN